MYARIRSQLRSSQWVLLLGSTCWALSLPVKTKTHKKDEACHVFYFFLTYFLPFRVPRRGAVAFTRHKVILLSSHVCAVPTAVLQNQITVYTTQTKCYPKLQQYMALRGGHGYTYTQWLRMMLLLRRHDFVCACSMTSSMTTVILPNISETKGPHTNNDRLETCKPRFICRR